MAGKHDLRLVRLELNRDFVTERNQKLKDFGLQNSVSLDTSSGIGTIRDLHQRHATEGILRWGQFSIGGVDDSYRTSYTKEDNLRFVVCPILFAGSEVARQIYIESEPGSGMFLRSKVQDKNGKPFIYRSDSQASVESY